MYIWLLKNRDELKNLKNVIATMPPLVNPSPSISACSPDKNCKLKG
jgi:hypothetical protein